MPLWARGLFLGYDLPGVKGTAGGFGGHANESGGNLPAYIADIGAAEVDGLVCRRISVSIEGEFSSAANCAAYA